MAEYPIVRETPQGDLILDVDGTHQRLRARRETPDSVAVPMLLDGTLLQDGRLQVRCIKYRWPDGYEKWGHYLGSMHTVEPATDARTRALDARQT